MALNWPSKSPDERLDYTLRWQDQLGTDTITSSTWVINNSGLLTDLDSYGPNTSTIWLLDGTLNQIYSVVNTIITAAGRTYVQTVSIKIASS